MSAQKQKRAWGASEKIKNEGSWCMVNRGGGWGQEAVEAAGGSWARMFQPCLRQLIPLK